MSDKFTPGPWKAYRANNGSLLGIGDAEAGGVTDYQGGFWRDGAEKRANIHLVVCAPEMFAVLHRVNHALATEGSIECGTDLACCVSEILAKARGQS